MTTPRERIWMLVSVATSAVAAAVLALAATGRLGSRRAESAPGEALYREVISLVRRDFVVPPDEERLVYGAAKGILAELDDPYSKAMPPAEWEKFNRESRGEAVGIGLEIAVVSDQAVVGYVVPGGPADRARIRPGDRVIAIAGKPVDPRRGGDAVERDLRGAAGGRITLELTARDGGDRRTVDAIREVYEAVQTHGKWLDRDQGVAVVRVAAFRSGSAVSFLQVIEALRAEGLRRLILDLRFDRGGAFEPAVAVADQWLSSGVICRTRGENRGETYSADAPAPLAGLPTVILVNGTTASAAEVLAGALQDTHSALLVGETTYGKGVVQELLPFATWAGGMKLTVARYYTPADRCVESRLLRTEEAGGGRIRPDVPVVLDDAERDRLKRDLDRFHFDGRVRGEIAAAEAAANPGREAFVDRQLEVAKAIVLGRYLDLSSRR